MPWDEDFDSNEPWRMGFAPAAPEPATLVYTTAGGRRFHGDQRCQKLLSAQALSDWDYNYEFPPPSGARLPRQHAITPSSPQAAALAGYTACQACVPPALALPATGETYGHKPLTEPDLWGKPQLVCARCTEGGARWGWDNRLIRVFWPCTSAVVLGLVPRCPDCRRGVDVPGGRKCASCEHSDQLDALGTAL
jgi:hypothetical protein